MPIGLVESRPRSVLMSADAVGGVWTYAIELARKLDRFGIDVHLAVLGPSPASSQLREARQLRRLKVIVTGLPLDWTARSEAALAEVPDALKAMALHSGAELVHLNAPAHAGIVPWQLPLVVAVHSCVGTWWRALRQGPLPADLAWRARRTVSGLAVADAIITPTQSFARSLIEAYGATLPVTVVPNGREPTNAELKPGSSKHCLLTAGRLWDPAKNVAAVDQAALISGMVIHAAGPVWGPNGERAAFPHLTLLGMLSAGELAGWYARTATFISLSRYEPFGLAVLEAAQAGAALVLSDIDTFRELWDGAALFVPGCDPHALAEALGRLRSDEMLRQHLGRCAGARSRDYSVDRMSMATLSVYSRALTARARHQPPRSAA